MESIESFVWYERGWTSEEKGGESRERIKVGKQRKAELSLSLLSLSPSLFSFPLLHVFEDSGPRPLGSAHRRRSLAKVIVCSPRGLFNSVLSPPSPNPSPLSLLARSAYRWRGSIFSIRGDNPFPSHLYTCPLPGVSGNRPPPPHGWAGCRPGCPSAISRAPPRQKHLLVFALSKTAKTSTHSRPAPLSFRKRQPLFLFKHKPAQVVMAHHRKDNREVACNKRCHDCYAFSPTGHGAPRAPCFCGRGTHERPEKAQNQIASNSMKPQRLHRHRAQLTSLARELSDTHSLFLRTG